MIILGLDISTSVIGCSILNEKLDIISITHIEFKNKMTFWQKIDFAEKKLEEIIKSKIDKIYIEEPVLGFSAGHSSANTIMMLAKFNYVISYIVRKKLNIDPIHITVASARKLCGLKMQQKKNCGKTHKEQTIDHMMKNDLKHIEWPKTKNGTLKKWVADEIDSYVVAKSGIVSELKKNSSQ